jgi:predicted DNA-binding protein (MmcQ/YjbR family)
MDIDAIRRYCLQFAHVTENVQWGCDLCFKVDGKLFLVMPLEAAPVRMSLKVSPENFAELCERPGVRPAPYMARAQWVALEQLNTLPDAELRELLAESYRLVFERLPKRRQQELQSSAKTAQRKAAAPTRKPSPTAKKNTRKLNVKTKRKSLSGRKKPARTGGLR